MYALWSALTSIGIGIISSLLMVTLAAGGDHSGALAVRGVLFVAVTAFAMSFVALVVLLAIIEIGRTSDNKPSPSDSIQENQP
ncbi:MAG: hypothetical protein FJ267_03160 [Planctomycetes bacterium]|nr:hypothetical protein [Planctomycetota bacterium]